MTDGEESYLKARRPVYRLLPFFREEVRKVYTSVEVLKQSTRSLTLRSVRGLG